MGEPLGEGILEHDDNLGRMLDPEQAAELERLDREHPTAGGEPECPVCSTRMVRHVEKHVAPRSGGSPFRIRLVCPSEECGRWTTYNW
ncbi:MAG: hypothetical protein V3W32_09495 [Gemmatimonadota bacterium]